MKYIALLLLLLCFIGGCAKDPNAPPVISNINDYNQALTEAMNLSKDHLAAFEQGETIGDFEANELRGARRRIQGLVNFRPTVFTLYTLLGKINLALGETAQATQNLQQAVRLAPKRQDIDIIFATADTYYWLAQALLRTGDAKAAEKAAREASKRVAQNPDYLCLIASTLTQQKRYDEALKQLEIALDLAPGHYASERLRKFILKAKSSRS